MGALNRARRTLGAMAVVLVFAAGVWMGARRIHGGEVPAMRQELAVIASLQEEGYFPQRLTVRRGTPVRVFATSADAVHTLTIWEFRIEARLRPGKVNILDFIPVRTGSFQIVCDYHPKMRAILEVVE